MKKINSQSPIFRLFSIGMPKDPVWNDFLKLNGGCQVTSIPISEVGNHFGENEDAISWVPTVALVVPYGLGSERYHTPRQNIFVYLKILKGKYDLPLEIILVGIEPKTKAHGPEYIYIPRIQTPYFPVIQEKIETHLSSFRKKIKKAQKAEQKV